ncbi:MAG: hypothetical protein ABIR57_09330, partial [Aeromicrobium sp.]
SVAMALIIVTIELNSVLVEQFDITGGPLAAIADVPLDYAGYGIVALFLVSWIVAAAIWRFGHVRNAGPRTSLPETLRVANMTHLAVVFA